MIDGKLAFKRKCDLLHGKRLDALGNPIEMHLTYEEWAQIWKDSGHWGEWGNRKGQYCMSRYNDIGHYEIGNVFIQLHSENTAEANRRRVGVKNPNFGKQVVNRDCCVASGKKAAAKVQECPHCGKVGQGLNMLRWHMTNCRSKK